MSFQLTEQSIKRLCGQISYDKGKASNLGGKVTLIEYGPTVSVWEADVKEKGGSCRVTVKNDPGGKVEASCTCPTLPSYTYYCNHIAAVLLNIREREAYGESSLRSVGPGVQPGGGDSVQTGASPEFDVSTAGHAEDSAVDKRLIDGLLGLFNEKPMLSRRPRSHFETRAVLEMEILCRPVSYGGDKHRFCIEIKAGTKRLYAVQDIREFLDRLDRGEASAFSRHFTYDPKLHSIPKEHDAVLRQLIQIGRSEQIYRETSSLHFKPSGRRIDSDRMLAIPPLAWEVLLPLLAEAPKVKLEQDGSVYEGICLSDGPIPLLFEFGQGQDEGFELDVRGMDKMTVMEAYGVVLYEGRLVKLKPGQERRLSELKRMLDVSRRPQIRISPEQMEPFMEKVVPALTQLGSVHIARGVSERLIRTPLKARLYLDRVRNRLLAGLEFQYGDIVINPLEGTNRNRGADRILVRDGDRELKIIELMEQSSFARTEAGYFMDDEDAEYEFLYRIVPQLKQLAEVYATSAVKARLFTEHAPPKITADLDERTDWLEFKFDMEGIPESDIRSVLSSLQEKRRYHKLADGALVPLESAEFQEILRFMNETGIRMEDVKGREARVPAFRGLHLLDAGGQGNAVKLGKSFRRLLENMRNPDHLDFPVPDSLTGVLRDYQKYGFQWLKTLAHYRFGGILADDMGLGKTVQGIALLVSVLPEIRQEGIPALIVCPASLLYNWQNELKTFAPELRTVIADGGKPGRSRILKDAARTDVIITSYPLLRRDIEEYEKLSFHTLLLDEAQFFKNYATQTARTVKKLQARYRFALTGTPVENSLEELWSIFDAVFPELFRSRKEFADLPREAVARRVRPFLLRRLKTDVLKELPEKIESLQASELLPDQKKLYLAYLAKLREETLKHLDEDGFRKSRIKILAGLTRLRQLCCHPALFVEDYAGSSAKFEQLNEIMEECRSAGKRMLVFSQFTGMLNLIGRELGYRGVPYFYLDGSTPASERVELCRRFNEGECDLFLISLKAGGTGLNLTGADTVILYDLWWNPAVEQQAADRAHRIGQKNVVQVIRLVARGTVEEKMYELQHQKQRLIQEVIRPGEETLSSLTEQEIREILMLG